MTKWFAIFIAAMALGCKRNESSASTPVDHPSAAVEQPCKVNLSNLRWDSPKTTQSAQSEATKQATAK